MVTNFGAFDRARPFSTLTGGRREGGVLSPASAGVGGVRPLLRQMSWGRRAMLRAGRWRAPACRARRGCKCPS
jgi:hypothetical protein